MNGFAIVKSDPNSKPIAGNTDTIALTITFLDDFGPCLIWGRLVLYNNDGDPQNAAAWLMWQRDFTNELTEQLDRVELRLGSIDDANQMSVSLQGWVTARKGQVIELHCATYSGAWREPSLIVLGIQEWRISA